MAWDGFGKGVWGLGPPSTPDASGISKPLSMPSRPDSSKRAPLARCEAGSSPRKKTTWFGEVCMDAAVGKPIRPLV